MLEAVAFIDHWLAVAMTRMDIAPNAQTALLIGVSIILVVAALRSLGAVFAGLVIILLVLLLLHRALPGLGMATPQPSPANPTTPHTDGGVGV